MSEDRKADDGRGTPKAAEGVTAAPRPLEGRSIPGGSMEAASRAVGINAVDRDMLPGYGLSPGQEDFQDSPDDQALRQPPPE